MYLRSVHHLVRHSFVFTVVSFNQCSLPPEFLSAWCHLERTHFVTSVLASHGISFLALMKIVVSTIETFASFQRVFMFLEPVEPVYSFYRSPGIS